MKPHDIEKLMNPWAGLADDDEAADYYNRLGVLSDEQYKQIIRKDFLPYYKSLNREIRTQLQTHLTRSLEDSKFNFERLFNSALPPFDPPENPKQFFIWIDEELKALVE